MSRENEVFKLKDGFNPYIFQDKGKLFYAIPVSSGHATSSYTFAINSKDLELFQTSRFHFLALHYILYQCIQNTFGTGHPNPRKFTTEEFLEIKTKITSYSKEELIDYIDQFSQRHNLGQNYFNMFTGEDIKNFL